MPSVDLSFCRSEFPALELKHGGRPVIFLDGPGGTQVPRRVIDRVTTYFTSENANAHGEWLTSQASDRAIDEARSALADFLGADPDEIAFGQNMTTLNFALSRALGRNLGSGDEIVITELDHEGNRAPWLALEETGATVKQVRVDPRTCTLDFDDFAAKLGPHTRIVAVGGASNAVGTVNDLARIRRLIEEKTGGHAGAGRAIFVVDAVHFAPHKPVDVRAMGCDFLLCSTYKFFGPHLGVLYGRREAFERLDAYKVRPQSDAVPFRIETGTLVHENIAAAKEAVEFVADLGRRVAAAAGAAAPANRRRAVLTGMEAIDAYEQDLAVWFIAELLGLAGLEIYGPPAGHPRTPTISIRLAGHTPEAMSAELGRQGIFTWAGDFYATTLIGRLGLTGRPRPGRPGAAHATAQDPEDYGVLRMGLAPYNTKAELERVLAELKAMAR